MDNNSEDAKNCLKIDHTYHAAGLYDTTVWMIPMKQVIQDRAYGEMGE